MRNYQARKDYLTVALLVLAILLGGRSDASPIIFCLLAIMGCWLLILTNLASISPLSDTRWQRRGAIFICVAILAVVILQIIPLPPSVWTQLPLAQQIEKSLVVAESPVGWRSLSYDWLATILTGLTLIAPVAIFWSTTTLSEQRRLQMIYLIVGLAGMSVLLGLLQFSSGSDSLYFYKTTHDQFSTGFFSNRNHQADLTLVMMLFVSVLYRKFRLAGRNREQIGKPRVVKLDPWFLLMILIQTVAALNIFATASRTGVALLVPVLILCTIIVSGFNKGVKPIVWGSLGIGAIFIALAMINPDMFIQSISRFEADDDLRFKIWPVAVDLVSLHFPFGSGLGTFVPIFGTVEPLEHLSERYVNHAHNDYIEIAMELGVAGMILLASFFTWLGGSALKVAARNNGSGYDVAVFGSIMVLLLHSLVDYSLRTDTLSVVFAFLLGLMVRSPYDRSSH